MQVFPTTLIMFMDPDQQEVCSLLKRLIHVKFYMCIISFRWDSLLALDENFIPHPDLPKNTSLSSKPCIPINRYLHEIPFVAHDMFFSSCVRASLSMSSISKPCSTT